MKIETLVVEALKAEGCSVYIDREADIITLITPDNETWEFTIPTRIINDGFVISGYSELQNEELDI